MKTWGQVRQEIELAKHIKKLEREQRLAIHRINKLKEQYKKQQLKGAN